MSSFNFLGFFFSAFLLISCVHSQDYTWNTNGLKSKINPGSGLVTPLFQLKGFQVKAQAKLAVKSDNVVYISLAYQGGKGLVNFQVVPSVYYTYKDANNKDSPRNNKCYSIPNTGLAYDTFYYEMWLRPLNLIGNNNISIQIYVVQQTAGRACISDAK